MQKNNFLNILALIIISLIARMTIETFGWDFDYRMGYLTLFAIVSAYYGIYAQRHNSNEIFDWIMDFKGAAQLGALYAAGIGITTYVYYKLINPYFLPELVAKRKAELLTGLQNTGQDQATIDAALENVQAMADLIYVPGNWSIITVASLTVLSLVYAIIFATITKFFPRFVNK